MLGEKYPHSVPREAVDLYIEELFEKSDFKLMK